MAESTSSTAMLSCPLLEAYTYLPESVQGFLTAGEVAAIMRDAGMANVTYRKLALGTVAVHVGEKEA